MDRVTPTPQQFVGVAEVGPVLLDERGWVGRRAVARDLEEAPSQGMTLGSIRAGGGGRWPCA